MVEIGFSVQSTLSYERTILNVMGVWGWGGGGIFEPHEFFSLTFPLYDFFLRLMHKYFLGFFGVFLFLHFSFKFSLARYIFLYLARPFPL